jgi:hypothetical protein
MASLDRHTLTTGLEAHAKLPFRADCPYCREVRLRGPLPSPEMVPRRAKAGLVAGMLAASAAVPAGTALGQPPPNKGEGEEAVLPPGGVEPEGNGPQGDSPAIDAGGAPKRPGPPVTGPPPQVKPPKAMPAEHTSEPTPAKPPEQAVTPEPPAEGPSTSPPTEPPPRDAGAREGRGNPSPPRTKEPGAGPAPKRGSQPPQETAERAATTAGQAPAARDHADAAAAPERAEGDGQNRSRSHHGSDARAAVARADPTSRQAKRVHVVEPGQSLWAIAERRLGPRASDAAIAREVNRLWELNDTEVIKTGDPDLILPGQRLRL